MTPKPQPSLTLCSPIPEISGSAETRIERTAETATEVELLKAAVLDTARGLAHAYSRSGGQPTHELRDQMWQLDNLVRKLEEREAQRPSTHLKAIGL